MKPNFSRSADAASKAIYLRATAPYAQAYTQAVFAYLTSATPAAAPAVEDEAKLKAIADAARAQFSGDQLSKIMKALAIVYDGHPVFTTTTGDRPVLDRTALPPHWRTAADLGFIRMESGYIAFAKGMVLKDAKGVFLVVDGERLRAVRRSVLDKAYPLDQSLSETVTTSPSALKDVVLADASEVTEFYSALSSLAISGEINPFAI